MDGSNGDWFEGAGSGGRADVAEMLDGLPAQALREIVELGALVSLGLTSDGGALGVTVTVDGRWRREYFRDQPTLLAWLGEAQLAVESAKRPDRPSPASRGRTRSSRSA